MLSDEWLTPKPIIDALGPFDLDPCAPTVQPWPTAAERYTVNDNGLALPWRGFVWCNPPYGREAGAWLGKLAQHGNGIALVFARTETRMFFDAVWPHASALLFLRGRLHFCDVKGVPAKANAGAPTVLIAYGQEARSRLLANHRLGAFVENTRLPKETTPVTTENADLNLWGRGAQEAPNEPEDSEDR